MRRANPETTESIRRYYPIHGTYRSLAIWLHLPECYAPTLSRIKRDAPGVGFDRENEIRFRLNLPPLPIEHEIYNPQTHILKPKPSPRKRPPCYRPYLSAAAGVLIRSEASRRNITPAALICKALGITLENE